MSYNIIELENISFAYGNKDVLKSLTFSISKNSIFGFLGPNGSGKTTTVRLINGILTPKSGSIRVFERDLKDEFLSFREKTGVLTETAALYKNLTGKDNIEFFGKLYGLNNNKLKERMEWLDKRLEISSFWTKRVKEMSTGMKKRIALAVALVHSPEILFLDEPTSGLDPETTLIVKDIFKELVKENGVTIFLCTHLLKEAEEICDVFGFLREGRLLDWGDMQSLLSNFKDSTYLKIRGIKPEKLNCRFIEVEKGVYHIFFDFNLSNADEMSFDIIKKWIETGGKIFEAKIEHWTLERLYFSYEVK